MLGALGPERRLTQWALRGVRNGQLGSSVCMELGGDPGIVSVTQVGRPHTHQELSKEPKGDALLSVKLCSECGSSPAPRGPVDMGRTSPG